jgi:hypothetical protein
LVWWTPHFVCLARSFGLSLSMSSHRCAAATHGRHAGGTEIDWSGPTRCCWLVAKYKVPAACLAGLYPQFHTRASFVSTGSIPNG